jgi:hypothetical protein
MAGLTWCAEKLNLNGALSPWWWKKLAPCHPSQKTLAKRFLENKNKIVISWPVLLQALFQPLNPFKIFFIIIIYYNNVFNFFKIKYNFEK